MVLAACLAGAKTSDSRNSFGQGWNEGCLVGNNEPTAPSGESAGQLPWQGIKTWRRKKKTQQKPTKKPSADLLPQLPLTGLVSKTEGMNSLSKE